MIFLFTDYGLEGPYIGQVESVIYQLAPQEKVINLMADAPRNNPKASSYLLASLIYHIPEGSILFCVVDPGVGSNEDKSVIIEVDNRWFVGPNNGLFDIVIRQSKEHECWQIIWEPENLSKSFYGRDLYSPVCAMIANDQTVPVEKIQWQDKHDWPNDLKEIIYIDHFGNAMTGIQSKTLDKNNVLEINNTKIKQASTFASVKEGDIFWYSNSNRLVEIAVNQGSTIEVLGASIGDSVKF